MSEDDPQRNIVPTSAFFGIDIVDYLKDLDGLWIASYDEALNLSFKTDQPRTLLDVQEAEAKLHGINRVTEALRRDFHLRLSPAKLKLQHYALRQTAFILHSCQRLLISVIAYKRHNRNSLHGNANALGFGYENFLSPTSVSRAAFSPIQYQLEIPIPKSDLNPPSQADLCNYIELLDKINNLLQVVNYLWLLQLELRELIKLNKGLNKDLTNPHYKVIPILAASHHLASVPARPKTLSDYSHPRHLESPTSLPNSFTMEWPLKLLDCEVLVCTPVSDEGIVSDCYDVCRPPSPGYHGSFSPDVLNVDDSTSEKV
ncbi:unnamed protein product, partial [Protopolystoma xenopodis]